MGPLKEELEVKLSSEEEKKEEKVFLFILKRERNMNYLEARKCEQKKMNDRVFSKAKMLVVSKHDI